MSLPAPAPVSTGPMPTVEKVLEKPLIVNTNRVTSGDLVEGLPGDETFLVRLPPWLTASLLRNQKWAKIHTKRV
jgi:hypothetical protein